MRAANCLATGWEKKEEMRQLSLVSVSDLSHKFKIPLYRVDRYIKANLLFVSKRIGNKRFLNRKLSENTMRQIIRLQEKGFSLRMIDRVVND